MFTVAKSILTHSFLVDILALPNQNITSSAIWRRKSFAYRPLVAEYLPNLRNTNEYLKSHAKKGSQPLPMTWQHSNVMDHSLNFDQSY